jgi:hypothetical protein
VASLAPTTTRESGSTSNIGSATTLWALIVLVGGLVVAMVFAVRRVLRRA